MTDITTPADDLPPLPEPNDFGNMGHPEGWSADQMHAYARLAIEQARAAIEGKEKCKK